MKQTSNMAFGDPVMRSLGTLKMPEEDVAEFQAALQAYDFESSATFLRRCAYALMKHHKAGETLLRPTAFRTERSIFEDK